MRIYFYTDGDAIKVGESCNEIRRGKELQTGNPRPLHLLGVIETEIETEAGIKRCLRMWRCDGGTEWFHPTPEVVEFVAGCLGTDPRILLTEIKKKRPATLADL
jgi:hypothetical protein